MASIEQEGLQPSGMLSANLTHKKSSEKDFQTPLFMRTLQRLILEAFQRSTCSQEDFPAKTSATLDGELASRGVVVHSGSITSRPLGFYDQSTRSLKTYQRSLIEDSTLSLAILPRSGMMRSGIVYRLPALVRLTGGTESSLLASEPVMWHTPSASEKAPAWDRRASNGGVRNIPVPNLHAQVQMWPTPVARDYKGRTVKQDMLPDLVGGALNPMWVEWLMGFPLGWTELNAS